MAKRAPLTDLTLQFIASSSGASGWLVGAGFCTLMLLIASWLVVSLLWPMEVELEHVNTELGTVRQEAISLGSSIEEVRAEVASRSVPPPPAVDATAAAAAPAPEEPEEAAEPPAPEPKKAKPKGKLKGKGKGKR